MNVNNKNKHIDKEKLNLLHDIDWLIDQNQNKMKSCIQISKELNVTPAAVRFYFKKYNIQIKNTTDYKLANNIRRQTCILKYGVENISQDKDIQQIKQISYNKTCIKKYGKSHTSQKHLTDIQLKLLNDKEWLSYQHIELLKTQKQISVELGVTKNIVSDYFRKHEIPVQYYTVSYKERQIVDFIKINFPELSIIQNDRTILTRGKYKPRELDIYIPELNLAFEYDGTYWHKNSKTIGRWKSFRCKELGITLYHLHEKFHDDLGKLEQIVMKIITKISNDCK